MALFYCKILVLNDMPLRGLARDGVPNRDCPFVAVPAQFSSSPPHPRPPYHFSWGK